MQQQDPGQPGKGFGQDDWAEGVGSSPLSDAPSLPFPVPYYGSTSSKTQRLHLGGGQKQGFGARLVAGIALLSLVIGGVAGAGAAEVVTHTQASVAPTSVPASEAAAMLQGNDQAALDASQLTVKVVQAVGPAVVSILNTLAPEDSIFGTSQATSAGSGIIIDRDGYILTNYHVVAQEQTLRVTFANGTSTSASLVGGDPTNDIAVIKVDTKVPAVATFGNSASVQTGETVIAIGNALGNLQNTVTEGIVSGLNRSLPNGNDPTGNSMLQNLIQTDAAINHGNSGGPLVDLQGQVIGINTAVVRSSGGDSLDQNDEAQGLGFAIPSNTAKQVADRLIFKTPSPYLGVNYLSVSAQIASAYGMPVGAFIKTVEANSPAAHAGLKKQDVITAVNGLVIDDQHDLKTVLDNFQIGDTVRLTIYRGGQIINLSVVLGKRPV
jgi:2-alkenal reductase